MRLTCPNCGARYEVADTMIPPEGRDVQCSNCTTTWFQPGPRSDVQPDAPKRPPAPPPDVAEMPSEDESDAVDAADAAPESPRPEAMPARPEIDPAVRDILREEAAREARLRQADAGPVESQPEMPLDVDVAEKPAARMRPDLDAARDAFETDKTELARPIAARDLFPDIDQINSTLRDSGDRSAGDADASDIDTLDTFPRRRRGVRIGFFLVVALAAGAMAYYANADRIIAEMPALAGLTEGYVAWVDGLRFRLDDLAQGLARRTQ